MDHGGAEEIRSELATLGFPNVLFDPFGPHLALGHAYRTEALLPLEPNGRGLDLSLTADHYLHRAFDAEMTNAYRSRGSLLLVPTEHGSFLVQEAIAEVRNTSLNVTAHVLAWPIS